MRTYYKLGSANAICDVCGFKFKLDELRQRWDGLLVCPHDFEYRHPQDFIRTRKETFNLPTIRPRPPDVFIEVCSVAGRLGVVGFSTVGCSIVGNEVGLAYLQQSLLPYHPSAVVGFATVGLARVGDREIFTMPGFESLSPP